MSKTEKDGIVKGAFLLGVGTFVSKLLGALYRIPLTNIIGGYGLGLYQMVFPVYAVLLDFSGASVPGALSKMISTLDSEEKENKAYNYLQTSIRVFALLGIVFSILLAVFAKQISKLQGNQSAYLGYLFLSPAVFLVCFLSCFRGYFQGLMNMKPTAISQIIEQTVKLVVGLGLAYLYRQDVVKAVAGATFAITVSEVVALFVIYLTYRKRRREFKVVCTFSLKERKSTIKALFINSFPIILVGILIPLSHLVDSFMVVNVTGQYSESATMLYGLLSGVVLTVINLPVAICYGISTVAIPSVASSNSVEQSNKRSEKLLLLTLLASVPCVIICFAFAPLIISILFKSLPYYQKEIAVSLLRWLSPCILLLSVIQTQNAILIGMNKLYAPSLNLLGGILIKTILSYVLMRNPEYNIYGVAFGVIACYFFTCLVNLFMIFTLKVKNERQAFASRQYSN